MRGSMEKIQTNVEKLAKDIVDSWDMDALIDHAQTTLAESLFTLSQEEFEDEWNYHYGCEETHGKDRRCQRNNRRKPNVP